LSNTPLQELICLMGQPVAGNPTQFMMERAFAASALDWRYLTFEISPDQLDDAMRGFRVMGFRGANFTLPHKVSVIPYLDELSQAAQLMGAVNCVVRSDDRLLGDNTDGKGFVQSLRKVTDPKEKNVVILGAGGASRAIAVELALSGVEKITVVNRTAQRGEELAELLNDKTDVQAEYQRWEDNFAIPEEADIVINATSIGLGDVEERVPIEVESLQSSMVVADVIFNPPMTWFLEQADKRSCTILDGLGMLVNQGVIAFKIWTGIDPDADVMRESLEEYLEI